MSKKEKEVSGVLSNYLQSGIRNIIWTPVLLFLFSSTSFGQSTATSEWDISADSITRLQNPQRIVAEGDIILKKRQQIFPPAATSQTGRQSKWAELLGEEAAAEPETTPDALPAVPSASYETKAVIRADWMSYNTEKQTIEARGNVSIESEGDRLSADQANISLVKETGSFSDAILTRSGNELYLEGEKIEKTGLKTYRIQNGWVITCRLEEGETPPWSFASSETNVTPGGYATLKHVRFKIRDVPVLYLPYLVVPVKTTRQTGFLFPEISDSSRDGFGMNFPFFINVSDSTDITIYPEYYGKRGFMPGAELRYVVDTGSKGKFMGSYLDDELSDPAEEAYYAETGFTHTNSDRYWIRGKADHDFSETLIGRLDVDVVSDRDYLAEFNSGVTGFDSSQESFLDTFGRGFENQSDDQRKNSFKILKSWTGSTLFVDFLAITDVRENKTDPTPLWKLPSVDYSGTHPFTDTTLAFEWDADYVNYWREDGVGGHRFDLFPRLSSPLPFGPYLETRVEAGVRSTIYAVETYGDATWDTDTTPSRFLPVFETELATTLMRDYALTGDYSSLSHSIRPFIQYDYIPEEDQNDLPSFDSVDRIPETNAFTYGIDSFLDLYGLENSFARQYGFLRVEQSFDLRSEASSEPFSPVSLKLGWRPLQGMSLVYKTEIPIEDDDNTIHGFAGSYTNSRGDRFSLVYRFNDEEDIEQINGSFKARVLPKLIADFNVEHSLAEKETNEATMSFTYLAQCWSVQLEYLTTPTEERVSLMFSLANLGEPFGFSF